MARVETVVSKPSAEIPPALVSGLPFVFLRPSEIKADQETDKSRPGPAPADEPQSIEQLAKELSDPAIGQIVPLVVELRADGYYVIDGRRRIAAATLIDKDSDPVVLGCAVRETAGSDPLRLAIHANLKRRGYSPLQFAHLCTEVRALHTWTGTKEVAGYLGVSRATVSQHDKLLTKPEGMDEAAYQDLLAKIGSGQMGADAAFYTLTHVEPAKTGEVLERATELAKTAPGVSKAGKGLPSTSEGAPSEPAGANARELASRPKRGRPSKAQKAVERVKTPEWMKEQQKKHQERIAKAKIEKKHIKQAAREAAAVRDDKPLQKTLPELRKLFEVLRSSAYPDVMRNFISVLADAWWRGDASDKEVISHWSQIAMLVEQQMSKTGKAARKPAAKKAPVVKKAPARAKAKITNRPKPTAKLAPKKKSKPKSK